MRSIFLRILAWFGILLLFSFVAFVITTALLIRQDNPVDRFTNLVVKMQLDDAVAAYQAGGVKALASCLERFNRYLPGERYLLDASGRDLATNADRAALLAAAPPAFRFPWPPPKQPVIRQATADGRYHLVIRAKGLPSAPYNYLPYYAWIVLVLVSLCYAMAFTLVKPLRQLRDTLSKFGGGDLAVRTGSTRRDEFGDVSRVFDKMADRIQALLTAERRLLQDISHELRSPLARLGFAVELARNAEDRQAALDRVKKEAVRISNLVGELLDMSRVEGDPGVRTAAQVDLTELVDSAVDDAFIEADARNCKIVPQIERTLEISGDAELLRRAMENVLRNALRHTPEHTAVEVSLRRENAAAVLTIRDHGTGVPPDMLEDIFRPFFRTDDDRSRSTGGVGLGLAIARRAIHFHHGEIAAENADPGLRITIRLPLAPGGTSRPRLRTSSA
ncbi:MAG: ATP-binding protein [Bryobacteraceae bacterium]